MDSSIAALVGESMRRGTFHRHYHFYLVASERLYLPRITGYQTLEGFENLGHCPHAHSVSIVCFFLIKKTFVSGEIIDELF
jgi:hypothetical protein